MVEDERSLVKKLAEIMGEVGYIPKNGTNKFQGYTYATESDVQDAVREKLSTRNVIMFPDVTDTKIREINTRKGNVEFIATVTIEYTIEDGDSGEIRKFTSMGEGQDSGNKAVFKAISGAQKYAIMKLFLMPTGDDPELDTQQPQQIQQSAKQMNPRQNNRSASKNEMHELKQNIKKQSTSIAKSMGVEPVVVIQDAFKRAKMIYSQELWSKLSVAQAKQAINQLNMIKNEASKPSPIDNLTKELNEVSQHAPIFDKDGNPV